MRLTRFQILRYGCFEAVDLRLAPRGLNLVIAPNGAGKSVLRQAFHDLLFDVPKQSGMKFRYPYKGMELHAEAKDEDGTPWSFGWQRGGTPERLTSDQARFQALRAGVKPEQLEQLFALDTARLRKGGTDLKGNDTLGAALLSGTGELALAHQVRSALEGLSQDNYGRGRSKPPLNAALATLLDARRAATAAVQSPPHRTRQEEALAAARAALADARTTLALA